jgi:MerR family copper efflux transcriptional regulator
VTFTFCVPFSRRTLREAATVNGKLARPNYSLDSRTGSGVYTSISVEITSSEKTFLRSGELARLVGISVDTLRHYERVGVLRVPFRTEGNYRLYPRDAVDRVRLVRHALSIGFSLPELAKILGMRDKGGAPCRQVKALLENKLLQVDRQLEELKTLRGQLKMLVKDWHDRLEQTPDGQPARLLETLSPLSKKGKLNAAKNSHGFYRDRNGLKRTRLPDA